MKVTTVWMAMAVSLLFLATGTFAAEQPKKTPSPAQIAQQERMRSCNAEAGKKALKGEERKKFMSGCLKAKK